VNAPAANSDDLLRALIKAVLNLRAERKAITADIAGKLKEARARGFDSRKITEVCIWLERVDEHGRDAMLEAEELFDLYRAVAEGPSRPVAELMGEPRDKALAEQFASPPDDKPKAPTTGSTA
jgi:uncharacterized protein (UPF0335 family)